MVMILALLRRATSRNLLDLLRRLTRAAIHATTQHPAMTITVINVLTRHRILLEIPRQMPSCMASDHLIDETMQRILALDHVIERLPTREQRQPPLDDVPRRVIQIHHVRSEVVLRFAVGIPKRQISWLALLQRHPRTFQHLPPPLVEPLQHAIRSRSAARLTARRQNLLDAPLRVQLLVVDLVIQLAQIDLRQIFNLVRFAIDLHASLRT